MHSRTVILAMAALACIGSGRASAAGSDPVQPAHDHAVSQAADAQEAEAKEREADEQRARIFARQKGFKPVRRGEEWVYCRRESVTATRMRAQEKCYTQRVLLDMEEDARRMLEQGTRAMPQPREIG